MSRRHRVATVLRGMAALITLLVLVVGLPMLLYRLGGSPIPRHIQGWHQIRHTLLSRDNGAIFLGAVRDVSWIAWAAFTAAVLAEAQAALRGRNAPRLGLGGLQATAGRLVAMTMLAFSGPAALLSVPQAVTVAAVATQPAAAAVAPLSPAAASPDAALAPHEMALAPLDMGLAPHDSALATPDMSLAPHHSALATPDMSLAPHHSTFATPDMGLALHHSALATPDMSLAPHHSTFATPDMSLAPHHSTFATPDMGLAPHDMALALPDAAAVPPAPESSGQLPAEHAAGADPQVMSMGFSQIVTVRPGDCLWTIAHRYLGHGDLYHEIVQLNLGHEMGGGQVFSDPSVIWPGWMLQLPAAGNGTPSAPHTAQSHQHGAHPSRERRFRRPHSGAGAGTAPPASASPRSAASPTPVAVSPAPAPSVTAPASAPAVTAPASAPSVTASVPQGPVGLSGGTGLPAADSAPPNQAERIPPLAVFAAGMLAGGAVVTLAGMRHRQRQVRRPGRRIPLPASAPVMEAEQRLRSQTVLQPATALRAALSDLGTGLIASGQPIPDITGIRLLSSSMEVLLASPASEPPPAPFSVPGGRQGMAWQLSLPGDAPAEPFAPTETGDLLPGLFTAGAVDDGFLLLDLEYLRVTAVDGPAAMVDQFLETAAAELATSELAGWYDLILVGCPELAAVGGRATSCDTVEEALDLLASKAVALRRRLSDMASADVRRHRLEDPGDEDWALALLVSRIPPTSGQLALLLDLASDPAGLAALVPGATAVPEGHLAPARIQLAADPSEHDRTVARILPLNLQAWPQMLGDAGYLALASLFATAAEDGDVAADAPPYDGSLWPTPGMLAAMAAAPDGSYLDLEPEGWRSDDWQPEGQEPEANQPEAWQPEGQRPEASPPEAWQPEGQRPEASPPEAWQPDGRPGQPEEWWPDDQQPEASQPEASPPEPSPPQASPPQASPPQARQADVPDEPKDQPSLRIGVLGTLTINGAPGALLPAQSQLVLALALNGQDGLSNQQLCYLLGADPDHPKPSDSLRQLIVRTRRQLGRAPDGREWIEHLGAGQYALHPETRFDWHEFDALTKEGLHARDAGCLREALRLIRGQPFTSCYHWSLDLALIETVRAQIVDAAEMLSGLELAAGDAAAAARAARTGLAGDNGAEQLWRALMRAEHAAGNMSGVRDAWSRCLDVIADIAADGEPHPETSALYRQLLESSRARPVWSPS